MATATTDQHITDLANFVAQATGCDPRTHPGFDGVTIEPCEQCGTLTAVTTVINGWEDETETRICLNCMRGEL